MTPLESALLFKILAGAGILFVIAYIGNQINFSNRFVNALVTAIIFAVIYAGLYFLIDRSTLPDDLQKISQEQWLQMTLIAAVVVFVVDLVANMISFSNRFMSAVTTAVLFAALFGAAMYFGGGVPTIAT